MNTTIPKELLDLKAQFDLWRQSRTSSRTPIPEHLWHKAVALLAHHPLHSICAVCKLHPDRLKRRAGMAVPHSNSPQQNGDSARRAFFHLPPPAVSDPTPPQSTLPSYRLQLERPDGARLTLTLSALDAATINSLCERFLLG